MKINRQHLTFLLILASTPAFSQINKKQWTIVQGVNVGKYINNVVYDRRVDVVSNQRTVLGNLGIGYSVSDKLMVGAGLLFNSYRISANDTISQVFPLEFGYRVYHGKRIAPAIWSVYSLPVTKRIQFLIEVSASIGKRSGNLEVVSVRDSLPTPAENRVRYHENETFAEFSITPSFGYRFKNFGIVCLNISEIGFRRDIFLTPEVVRKDDIWSSLSIVPLKIGMTFFFFLPSCGKKNHD